MQTTLLILSVEKLNKRLITLALKMVKYLIRSLLNYHKITPTEIDTNTFFVFSDFLKNAFHNIKTGSNYLGSNFLNYEKN